MIATGATAIDGSSIAVCKNHRIYSHKTMKKLATRMKGSMGYWYGLKLHLAASEDGKILLFDVTSANYSERKFLEQVINSLKGICIADAGYVSQALEKMAAMMGSILFTCQRKNTKKVATHWQTLYLNKRVKIESIFSVLKERMGLETPLPRSVMGWFAQSPRRGYTIHHLCLSIQEITNSLIS